MAVEILHVIKHVSLTEKKKRISRDFSETNINRVKDRAPSVDCVSFCVSSDII